MEFAKPNDHGDMRELRAAAFSLALEAAILTGGGEEVFGDLAEEARSLYAASLVGNGFASSCLEVPLAGPAGFDFHTSYNRGQVSAKDVRKSDVDPVYRDVLLWFAEGERHAESVSVSYDLCGLTPDDKPHAHYYTMLGAPGAFSNRPGFFAAGRIRSGSSACDSLEARLPDGWWLWYVGLFPARDGSPFHVGAYPTREQQARYAADPDTLRQDLARAGFVAVDGPMLETLAALAALPLRMDFQFNVFPDGRLDDVLGISMTCGPRDGRAAQAMFTGEGAAARACRLAQERGWADERWKKLTGSFMTRAVPLDEDGSALLAIRCLPAYVKFKWRACSPMPAKAYIECGAMQVAGVRQLAGEERRAEGASTAGLGRVGR